MATFVVEWCQAAMRDGDVCPHRALPGRNVCRFHGAPTVTVVLEADTTAFDTAMADLDALRRELPARAWIHRNDPSRRRPWWPR